MKPKSLKAAAVFATLPLLFSVAPSSADECDPKATEIVCAIHALGAVKVNTDQAFLAMRNTQKGDTAMLKTVDATQTAWRASSQNLCNGLARRLATQAQRQLLSLRCLLLETNNRYDDIMLTVAEGQRQ